MRFQYSGSHLIVECSDWDDGQMLPEVATVVCGSNHRRLAFEKTGARTICPRSKKLSNYIQSLTFSIIDPLGSSPFFPFCAVEIRWSDPSRPRRFEHVSRLGRSRLL